MDPPHASLDATAVSLPADGDAVEDGPTPTGLMNLATAAQHLIDERHTTAAQHLIDERHMWISKCITQTLNVTEGDFSTQIERIVSSGIPLERINRFLAPHGPRGLFCLIGAGFPEELRLVFDPSEVKDWPVKKVLYFVRINNEEASVSQNIAKDVIIGQFASHAIKSFCLMLDHIYGPMLPKMTFPDDFSEDDKHAFFSELSKFSMTMVDVVQTIDCRVNFTRVNPGVLERGSKLLLMQNVRDRSEGNLSEQDLHHLEVEVAGQWLPAVERELDFKDDTLHSIDDLSPEAPLTYWRERLAHLNSLNEHLESKETRDVVNIWELQLPEKAKAWYALEKRLREGTQEANDNVKALTGLHKYFQVLYNGTPNKISEELLTIFSKVKIQRYMSKYLQRDECMTGLLVKIVNQIIIRCKQYLKNKDLVDEGPAAEAGGEEEEDAKSLQMNTAVARAPSGIFSRTASVASRVQEAFSRSSSLASAVKVIQVNDSKEQEAKISALENDIWSQDTDLLLNRLEECIKLNHVCQLRYREVKNDASFHVKDMPFAFDESQIFAKFVHFEKRLEKLQEFFKAYKLFALLREQHDAVLQSICATFFKIVEVIKGRSYDVLDMTATTFDAEFENVQLVVAELEQQLQDYIHENFKHIESTAQALELLSGLHALMQRDSLKPYLSAKYLNVFNNFSHDLDVVSNIYETQKDNPPMPRDSPPVAGRIVWVRHLLKMIEIPMHKFSEHTALMISRDSKFIIKKYNQIAQAFVAYEVLWGKAWQKAVQAAKVSINATLLVVHPEDGNLYVNFDSALLQVMREAKCMRPLGVEIPDLVVDMMSREATIKNHAARLKFLLEDYQDVKQRIVPDLMPLFVLMLESLEKALGPGLRTITWSSIKLDEFIEHLFEEMSKARAIIERSRDLYENRVVSNLSFICKMNLVRLPEKLVTTANFISVQAETIKAGNFTLNQKGIEIESAVCDIIALVIKSNQSPRAIAILEQGGQDVLVTVWNKLYSAVLSCFNISFEKLKTRIKTSLASGLLTVAQSFFKVDIELLPPQVKASPSIDDVQQAVNRTAKAILGAMKVAPWRSLTEKSLERIFDISDKVLSSIEVVRGVLMLTGSIEGTRKKVMQHIQQFYAYKFLWTLDKKVQVDAFLETRPLLTDYIHIFGEYEEMIKEIFEIPNITYMGPICLSNELIKFSLKAQVDAWKHAYTTELIKDAELQVKATNDFIKDMKKRLDSKVRDLDEVRTISETLQQIVLLETDVEQTFNLIDNYCQVAKEFGHPLSPSEEQMTLKVRGEWMTLQKLAAIAGDRLFRTQENFKKDLLRALTSFTDEVQIFNKDFTHNGPMFERLDPAEGIKRMTKYQKLYEEKARKVGAFQQGEDLFGLPKKSYIELERIKRDLVLVSQLYTLYTSCMKSIGDYKNTAFKDLGANCARITEELRIYSEKSDKLDKDVMLYVAYSDMKSAIREVWENIPVVEDMVKPSLRDRHWREIAVVTQTVVDVKSRNFCFKDIIAAGFHKYRFKVQEICMNADEELTVEEKLETIARQWHSASATFKNYKTCGPVLFDVPALHALLEAFEETVVLLQSLSASRHGLPFKETIEEHLKTFAEFRDLMDIWFGVQHVWWYVNVVFSSDEVSKQLPQEAQRFLKVNRVYLDLMQQAFSLRYVPVLHEKSEEFRNTLAMVMEDLEYCEKHLAGYLDSKRDSFPRLYYISDKVLLEALSQTSGLDSIEDAGVLSLFSNISKLILSQARQAGKQIIESVQSQEAELLEFSTPVKESSVEIFLTDLECEIQNSLKKLTQGAIRNMVPNLASLDIQVVSCDYPCQTCILASQCWFANMCESAFRLIDEMNDMKEVSRKLTILTTQLSAQLRGPLTRSIRSKFESLCTINIMHQDIVAHLVQNVVRKKDSWEWQRQLKFGTDGEPGSIFLEATVYKSPYTYEFIGCKKRLVCTPQTNKCYLFMLQAVATSACACLSGSSGCGKSETFQELGRLLGRFVLQFTCSAEVGFTSINNIILGLTKTGSSWVNFDEISRLPPGLLSVMAQQISSVLDFIRFGVSGKGARKNSRDTAQDNSIVPTTYASGIFCSTNLELATERARLPDNLRSRVRVLALMEPDVEVVAFVKLSLASFWQAALLASKIRFVYKTCAVMLSYKKEYKLDFRNALAVVNLMVEHQQHTKLAREEELLFAAKTIRDYNEPQLEGQDIPMLELVLKDVFGVFQNRKDSGNLGPTSPGGAMKAAMEANSDSPLPVKIEHVLIKSRANSPILLEKCLQAYELSRIRSGLTFLGESFTGKTLCCRSLLLALSMDIQLTFKSVHINPVALGPKHLFGWYDTKSNEWMDGTFSAIWRRAARLESIGTWVILDGPINPMWIEYLNTSIDDSQMFTLANGDRIATKKDNKLIFEVDKLTAVSPATISRTGIVHFSKSSIDHKDLLTAWLAKRRTDEQGALSILFERFVEPIVEMLQEDVRAPVVPINVEALTQQFLVLMGSFLADSVIAEELPLRGVLERYVLISAGWAYTGLLDLGDRRKIEAKLRTVTSNMPDNHKGSTLIDYILSDTDGGESQIWTPAKKFCQWSYPLDGQSADSISRRVGRVPKFIVPTPRAVATAYIVKWMTHSRIATLVMGARGTGKSTICTAVLDENRGKNKVTARVTLSRRSTNSQFQDMIERCVIKRQGVTYGPAHGKSLLVLVEDLNLPHKDPWGDEPCAEAMRYLLESGSMCSLQKPGEHKIFEDVTFVASSNMRCSGTICLPERLLSRCLVAFVPNPGFDEQTGIFEQIVQRRNNLFPSVAYEVQDAFVHAYEGCIKLIISLGQELMPCRRYHHWDLTLHNTARLCQAFLAMQPDAREISSDKLFASFFCHECERELCDQLPEELKERFQHMVEDSCKLYLKVDIRSLRKTKPKYAKVIWTHLKNPQNIDTSVNSPVANVAVAGELKPVESLEKFHATASTFLDMFNNCHGREPETVAMDLILFPDFVKHLLRLSRVLRMERGHAALIGAARCGKKSIVRLAAYLIQVELMILPSNASENIKVVQDTLRRGFTAAGLKSEEVIFAVSIDPRTDSACFDAISCAIRNADMKLLASQDDFERLLNSDEFQVSIKKEIEDAVKKGDPEAVDPREVFRARVLRNVHFVLSFSMSLKEFSDLQLTIPGECMIDLWLPYQQDSLEFIAQETLILLEERIDQHTETFVVPEVRTQVLEDMREEKEQSALENPGMSFQMMDEEYDAEEEEKVVAEALRIQRELRHQIKQRIRLTMPRQMAMTHIGLEKVNQEFSADTGHSRYLSDVSFRGFCRSFLDIFMRQFEKQYDRRSKLKFAVKTVARCETDLSKAQNLLVEEQTSLRDDKVSICEEIMGTIKQQTSALEKVKILLADMESQLIGAQDALEDIEEQHQQGIELREREQEKVVRNLQFFSPDTVSEIVRLAPVPVSIAQLFDVLLIFLGHKLNPIRMIETNVRTSIKDSWMHAVNLLKRPTEFCSTLQNFDVDSINAEHLELIQPYITSEELSHDRMQQISNGLAAPLVPWIHAVVQYFHTAQESLRITLNYKEISKARDKLQVKVAELTDQAKGRQADVELLRSQYDEAVGRKQAELETKKMREHAIATAADLIVGLRVQQARWSQAYTEYLNEVGKLAGNSSIAAAFLTYCGALDSSFRYKAVHEVLMDICKESSVVLNLPIDNMSFLSSDVEIAEWRRQGLVPDDICAENACLVKRTSSWPLIIDPYGVAQTWIERHHKAASDDAKFIHSNEDKIISIVQQCISFGIALFIKGVDTDFLHDLGDLYDENFRGKTPPSTVTLNGEAVPFNSSFQLYFSTQQKIPQYSDIFVSRISVVNFGSSAHVLELRLTAHLLDMADSERALSRIDLFQRELDLQVQVKRNQDRLIDALCEIQGNVVESVSALNEIKGLREEVGHTKNIKESLHKEREKMMKDIAQHVEVADQCRRLLDTMFSISLLKSTYLVSVKMFIKTMEKIWHEIPQKIVEVDRLRYFVEQLRVSINSQVSAGLVPEHKLVWSLLLALQATGKSKDILSDFDLKLLIGEPQYVGLEELSQVIKPEDDSNYAIMMRAQSMEFQRLEFSMSQHPWITSRQMQGIFHLQKLWAPFGDGRLVVLILNEPQEWKFLLTCPEPENEQIPFFDTRNPQGFTPFHRLVLLRFLRPDRFAPVVRKYVNQYLEPALRQPAGMNIHQAYTKSDSNTPIVIITCKNVNVAKIIIDVAKTKVIRCHPIALGTNGQREVAQKMMLTAPGQGIWLVLENGHLDLPYLAAIPRTMEEIHYSDEHFRLYITAEAAPNFPTNLLEIALRQYAEPAIGLKAKMISSLSWIEQDMIDSSSTSNWITLLYSMSFLHSWMLARKEFVQSAWCEQHEFHRSDLLMSFHFMQSIIEANENKGRGMLRVEVPWPTVQQVFAEIILGSALNQVDQVVLETQIKRYMSTRILSSDFHYGLDFPGPFGKDFQSTIRQLGIQTLNETAEVFGLDAWVGWETEEIRSDNTLTCLRLALSSNSEPTFPTTIQGNEHFILESATRMLGEMPQSLEPELDALKPPYNLLASSECYQLNRVLGIARNDLRNVVENLKNGLQFTSKNDSIAKAMLLGQTPKRWMSLSFGIQSLATWSSHLRESHSQVSARMRGVQGPVAIGHCFSPASVIRHHLLYVCSKHRWPHESAKLTLKISGADGGAGETAKELVLTGILLEGAGWDSRHSKLVITPATAGKRTLMPLPPARLIVEQGHGGTQTVVGDSVVACKVPLYPSKSHRGGEAILEAALMTDLPQHVLVLSACALYCVDDRNSIVHRAGMPLR